MKIERIVRHFGIKFAREFKKDNPKKFTPKTGELSKSKKAESILETINRILAEADADTFEGYLYADTIEGYLYYDCIDALRKLKEKFEQLNERGLKKELAYNEEMALQHTRAAGEIREKLALLQAKEQQ